MNASGISKWVAGIGLLMLMSGPASAYICSGLGNEFQDENCNVNEITAGLTPPGTFAGTFLGKDDVPLDPAVGTTPADEIANKIWGTLQVVQTADTIAGRVYFTWAPQPGITTQVIVEKADNWYSVYDWNSQVFLEDDGPFAGNWYFDRVFPEQDFCPTGPGGTPNCSAETSHVSAYGVVPIPAAVWLLGGALIGLVGVARRKAA